MFWTAVALVMTVLMGGIIAYNGDLIGRKYGKKRVTMFGLRPKHTAILITSFTGVAISALTTGVLFLIVPNVRDIILHGEAAIRARKVYIAEIATLKDQALTYRGDLSSMERRLLSGERQKLIIEQQVRAETAKLRTAQQKLGAAQASLAETRKTNQQLHAGNARLLASNADLKSSNITLKEINVALGQQNVTLARANEDLQQTNGSLRREIAQYTEAKKELVHKNGELAHANDELSSRNVDLTRDNAELTRARDVLIRTNDLARQHNDDLLRTNKTLTAANERLAAENSDLSDIVKKLAPNYGSITEAFWAARNRRVAVHKDEDLARKVVPAGTAPEVVRQIVMDLMHEASVAAIAKGAAAGDSARAVQVVDRQFVTRVPGGGVQTVEISANDRIDSVVSRLAWQTTPSALLAIAVANTVEEEPAAIDLQPLPDRLVYPKGQVVNTITLNAIQSPDRIFDEVVRFLKQTGQSALERGVIPRMDPTGEPQVGVLGGTDIVKLVERVRAVGGRARIKAIARQDITSVDPLLLDFQITQ